MELITSADIVGYNADMLSRYERAMLMKAAGNYDEAEELLLPSVNPPSIYHGHYRELFILWRKKIIRLSKLGDDKAVIELLLRMFKLNAEMLNEMARYWSEIHGVERKVEYFASYSKINKTDITLLKRYANNIDNIEEYLKAEKYLLSK
ncbi:hypothetical protein C5952_17700 [Cronobacter sakazakii]|uniref:hypothetical protein n=1 Tax=Cronobacter sakazakii TaxID=28141 RepID=UPI000A120AB4|nr:hypothetical protein [Cronobacter sakazakii]ELY6360289.1 hypothetical protein [Cronobacter sakazakii]PQX62859.1 hypothetical protein C5952_17700 [Cronobacter sakazakii]PQY06292.1 hypothetical protein C5936_09495 [Cronobacter sakazakii]HDK7363271.1 hypothetical protein [Cronobacter sakazakii]